MRKETVNEKRNADTFRLAVHRTELANQRTLLAFARTSIALCASAVALIQLKENTWLEHVGWAILPVSAIVLATGVYDYLRVRASINSEKKDGGLD